MATPSTADAAVDSPAAIRFALALAIGAGLWLAHAEQPPEPDAPARSVRDGVYTATQAARGKAVYIEQCVACHKEDLRGDQQMTPSLVGIAFTFRWRNKTLYDYFAGLRNTMPQSAPASLGDETYADLVAYLLAAIGYPSGASELTADPVGLAQIAIEEPLKALIEDSPTASAGLRSTKDLR